MQNPFETGERRAFRETIRRYVETEIKPNIDEWDEAGDFPWRVHEELGAMGFFGFGASEAMQILGGAGYLRRNPVERIYREVKVFAIGGGSEEIMRDLAVRQMGL